MSAFVSLAFAWRGSLRVPSRLRRALVDAGLVSVESGAFEEGQLVDHWRLAIAGHELPVASRSYAQDVWVSTALDLDEARFEAAAGEVGRALLVAELVALGGRLVRALGLRYLFFDEEAEAEIAPDAYRADRLFGITLIARGVPGLEETIARTDLVRVDAQDWGYVIWRRPDPVPHHA